MEIHPGVRTVYYLLLLFFAAALWHPWTALVCILAQLVILAVNAGAAEVRRSLLSSLFLILFFAAVNGLLNHRGATPLLFINETPVTAEALLRGAMAGGMAAALILIFRASSCFMDNGKLLYVIGRISPSAALMVCMTLRFIPYYGRQLKQLRETQRALGYHTRKSALKFFWALLSENLERSIDTQLSMRWRGFGSRRRAARVGDRYCFWRADAGLLTAVLLLAAGIAAVWIAGGYRYIYFPRIVSAAGAPAGIALYGVFCALPLICQIGAELKWRIYIKSKI